jgi:hypothetical protein
MVPMRVDGAHDVVGLDSSLFVECTLGPGVSNRRGSSELSRTLTQESADAQQVGGRQGEFSRLTPASVMGIYSCCYSVSADRPAPETYC